MHVAATTFAYMPNKHFWDDWELSTHEGRQVWNYKPSVLFSNPNFWTSIEGKELLNQISVAFTYTGDNHNSADKVYRHVSLRNKPKHTLQPQRNFTDAKVEQAYLAGYKAIDYYQTLQTEEGHFPGDYGGPMFLLPGMVIAGYITQSPLPEPHRTLVMRYMLNHQRADGGWGLHIEGQSTMFGTVLHYVSLRLLGQPADAAHLIKARNWIRQNGGTTYIPSWGKFYLATLGVYSWEGVNSLFPEMWVLPKSLPFHPWRYWCHARMVYLPMAYCYGHKLTGEITPLIKELRSELYNRPFDKVNWCEARNRCAKPDAYANPSPLLKYLNLFTNAYEKLPFKPLRKKALKFIAEYIKAEDEQTKYINIGPVNQVINSIAVWHSKGKDSAEFKRHYERWFDYLWLAEDGMKMNGYNGSQLWDTAFAVQAITEGGYEQEFPDVTNKAHRFIDNMQVRTEVRDHEKYFRHDSVGGWPFSNRSHGWPITDCTAEGLKCMLHTIEHDEAALEANKSRYCQTADLLLSFQNKDGGWASYEKTRAPDWVEKLNPSEIFGNIMLDYSYTECSSASLQSLVTFKNCYPGYRTANINSAIQRGAAFLKGQQRADGSWYGSWAVCFTYGTWFGVDGLLATGEQGYDNEGKNASAHIQNACNFLVSKQNGDGGWGESFESCLQKKYIPHAESQIVNTAWAVMALIAANYPDRKVIDKGIAFILKMQEPNGDFPQQAISGVFNHTCMITYTSYRNVFPIWAISRYVKRYGNRE